MWACLYCFLRFEPAEPGSEENECTRCGSTFTFPVIEVRGVPQCPTWADYVAEVEAALTDAEIPPTRVEHHTDDELGQEVYAFAWGSDGALVFDSVKGWSYTMNTTGYGAPAAFEPAALQMVADPKSVAAYALELHQGDHPRPLDGWWEGAYRVVAPA